jgi:hypothetical protein
MHNRWLVACFFALSATAATACGGAVDPVTPPLPPPLPRPAPADAGPVVAGTVTQHGTIIDYRTKKPIAGATVSAAGKAVTSDATGAYAFSVEPGVPYIIAVTAPGYDELVLQERSIDADEDDGVMNLVSTADAALVISQLDGYDPSLGALSVWVLATGNCWTSEGATVSVSPAGAAKVKYFAGGMPSASQTSVVPSELPSAIIYNTQPGVPLTVTVGNTACRQVAFPTVQNAIRYTGGGITTEAGGVTTFMNVFLK